MVLVVLLTWNVRSSRGSNTRSATTKSTTKQEQNADKMEAYLRFFYGYAWTFPKHVFLWQGDGEGNPTNNSMKRLEKVVVFFFWRDKFNSAKEGANPMAADDTVVGAEPWGWNTTSWEPKGTPVCHTPPRDKTLWRDYWPWVSLNKAGYFLGRWHCGGPLKFPWL